MFAERIFPVLTPLAVDPGHPFPYISNLSLNLAVIVRDPVGGERRFARVKVPPVLPGLLAMPDGKRFVALEQVIAAHLEALFPGMEIESHHPFRVTRNADLTLEEEEADDLLEAVEMELRRRRFGRAVRLEVDDVDHRRGAHPAHPGARPAARGRLRRGRPARPDGPVGHVQPGPPELKELKEEPFVPVRPARLSGAEGEPLDVFSAIRQGDILVQHPYESFAESVEAFITQASRDPDVLAIKQTLYRTSGDSPIVRALIRAAEQGKQVAALVELKARGDEAANIGWARALEEAGRARGLRPGRAEDPLQDRAGGAPGGRRHPPLLPHRHRQLQLQHGPALRGHRHPHRLPRPRRRPDRPVQLPDRLQPPGRVPAPAGGARPCCGRACSS